ncbi:hypothetical protein [Escherichia coli]|uniref:hypothetical protein n=1 Tax=Escherichia coli TaxID=562 RepID=UPI000F05C962|nr:hypothetical protein [Escherichia coli]
MPLTAEALEKELSAFGFTVRHTPISATEKLVVLTDTVTKVSLTFTMSQDGRVLDDSGRWGLPRVAPVAVTRSGYLILLNDIERQVTELVKLGELQAIDAVVVTDGIHDYLLPAEMKSALPPNFWNKDVIAYEDAFEAIIVVYGPMLDRTLYKRRKRGKSLYTIVNGIKPERVLDKLWKQFLNVE